jgi:hypothetical protein
MLDERHPGEPGVHPCGMLLVRVVPFELARE